MSSFKVIKHNCDGFNRVADLELYTRSDTVREGIVRLVHNRVEDLYYSQKAKVVNIEEINDEHFVLTCNNENREWVEEYTVVTVDIDEKRWED